MRTQAEWNVDTRILRATGPTSAATRPFISSAALLVKVMARISNGETPWSLMSQATLEVSTLVLPEPAPATMSSGPPGWVTASRCTGLRLASRSGGGMWTSRVPTVCFVRADPGNGRPMRAVVWHGKGDVRVDTVDDPKIQEPTDAIVRVTSTAICGSDLHLYTKLWPVMDEGDIIGHEPMGIVEEVGAEVPNLRPGDRVVIPFNISCGWCDQCSEQMYSQCSTTQNKSLRK